MEEIKSYFLMNLQ